MTSSSNSQEVQSSREQFLDKLETFVEHQLNSGQISIEMLSNQAGVSPATLYRKVKEATGLSPVEFTREFQLKKAAGLMDKGFGNVSEVAYEAGFNNLSYFSKCFTDKYGINPSSYNKLRLYEKDISKYLNSFIGREKEVSEIIQLIGRHRLVNITGPAGTGKTRLAQEVLNTVKSKYSDGVYAVYMGPISDAEFVPSAILQALQITELPHKSAMDTLLEYLQIKQLLLLIDNFEHLSVAATKLHTLLERCDHLKILVTSRLALRLSGEFQYPLQPLAIPEPVDRPTLSDLKRVNSNPSIQLFKDRAKQFGGGFDITVKNASDAIAVCRKLDGLPLALELAASQTKFISLNELSKRLDEGLSILKSNQIDRSPHHKSLQKALSWSYELLREKDQRYFQRLALIPASFDLKAAEAMWVEANETNFLDGLRILSDNNLIQTYDNDGELRFKLLETLKTFGRNKLKESRKEKSVVQNLAGHYLDLAQKAEKGLNGQEQKRWIDNLNLERDNFRGILKYLEQYEEVELGLQLSTSLWRYWNMQNLNSESRNWLRKMIDQTDRLNNSELTAEIYELKGIALSSLGIVDSLLLNMNDSIESLRQSLTVFQKLGKKDELAINLNHLGWALVTKGEYQEGIIVSEEALCINKKLKYKRGISVSLCNLAEACQCKGNLVDAKTKLCLAISIRKEIRDYRGVAYLSIHLARVEQASGEFDTALNRLKNAYSILEQIGDMQLISWHNTIKGLTYYNLGVNEEVRKLLEKAIEGWEETGNKYGLGFSIDLLGLFFLAMGDAKTAKQYLDEAAKIWKKFECRYMHTFSDYCLGEWQLNNGNVDQAIRLHKKALRLRTKLGLKMVICESLEALADLFLIMEDYERSALFLSASTAIRKKINAPVPPRFKERLESIVMSCEKEFGYSQFDRLWKKGKGLQPKKILTMI